MLLRGAQRAEAISWHTVSYERCGIASSLLLLAMPEQRFALHGSALTISSVTTVNFFSVFGPNVVLIGTSAASRPRAMSTRPMRGVLCRASNVYHRPPR